MILCKETSSKRIQIYKPWQSYYYQHTCEQSIAVTATNGAFPLHGTVRFTFGGFSTGYCTWYFFSTTSAEVPSDPYRYQNVTCKLCWSRIGRRESSLLRHWTCHTRPTRFKSAQPAKEQTQLLFQQTHLFASTTNYLFHCLLRKFRRSSRW